ncbi:MAG: hypothetical protein J6X69_02225 [Bacteroidales bacterium]|nr:hypothetical protein [Bacteroidales bacterium]
MEKQVDKLSMGQLSGLVNSYPWFASARMELARRLVKEGGWSREELSRMLMHIGDAVLLRPFVAPLLSPMMSAPVAPAPEKPRRVPGGDFFTREEYEKVKKEDDIFPLKPLVQRDPEAHPTETVQLEFVTETLAQIYASQGYFAQAMEIYEKLILAYPEKSAYFAALIEKLKS